MRLLVVEDDPKLATALRQGLGENGYTVDLANDFAAGLSRALERSYDALLLDLMLPGGDGLELLRRLRQRGRPTPVLVLSARSRVSDRVRGLDLGADDYLPKPFDFDELLARLRAITRRPASAPVAVLRAADLALDPARRRVRRSGRPVELTSREFALLEFLMRRKGLVVTRAMILSHVWQTDYDAGSNIVDVYVNYLRRKLENDDSPKLIHTVRGVGYVLRDPD